MLVPSAARCHITKKLDSKQVGKCSLFPVVAIAAVMRFQGLSKQNKLRTSQLWIYTKQQRAGICFPLSAVEFKGRRLPNQLLLLLAEHLIVWTHSAATQIAGQKYTFKTIQQIQPAFMLTIARACVDWQYALRGWRAHTSLFHPAVAHNQDCVTLWLDASTTVVALCLWCIHQTSILLWHLNGKQCV